MAGFLRHLLVVHTPDVVVTVIAAAGHQHRAASVASVVGAHHCGGIGAELPILVEEVALGALRPQWIQVGDGIEGLAYEVSTAGGLVGFECHCCAAGADVLLRMGGALHLIGFHAIAALHIEILALLGGDSAALGRMVTGLVTLIVVGAVLLIPELRIFRHQLANVVHIHAHGVHAVQAGLRALIEVLAYGTHPRQRYAVHAVEVLVALGRIGHPFAIQSLAAIAAVLVAVGQRVHATTLAGIEGLVGGAGQDGAVAIVALNVLVAGAGLANLGPVLEKATQLLVFTDTRRKSYGSQQENASEKHSKFEVYE